MPTTSDPGAPLYRTDGQRIAADDFQFWGSPAGGAILDLPVALRANGRAIPNTLALTGTGEGGVASGPACRCGPCRPLAQSTS